jgi:hypothetical protein
VPTLVEFAGFFVPDYAQCTQNWGMTLEEFTTMACMLDGSIEAHPDVELAGIFSLLDTCNNCTLNQYEVSMLMTYMEVPADEQVGILEYLGGFAGEDQELDFNEFKEAVQPLFEDDGPTKKRVKRILFKGRKQSQNRKQLVKSLKFLREHIKTLTK